MSTRSPGRGCTVLFNSCFPAQKVHSMSTLQTVVDEILDARSSISSERSVLTAITGIDPSGKGYFTERLVDALQMSCSSPGGRPAKRLRASFTSPMGCGSTPMGACS